MNGKPIFHSFLDSGRLQDTVQNYRAFRYNLTGYSPEIPAAAAFYDKEADGTEVHVSWNGLKVLGKEELIITEALDKNGSILSASTAIPGGVDEEERDKLVLELPKAIFEDLQFTMQY